MKEGFLIGIMMGAIGGMLIYRYSHDVQKAADKGEKMILEELQNCKKQAEKSMQKATKKQA